MWRLVNPRDAFQDTPAAQAPTGQSAFDRVVAELKDVRHTAKGVRARCPAHDDSDPSLDVDLGDDGRVLLNCRSARCTTESIVAALNLSMRDLFPQQGLTAPGPCKPSRREKARHPSPDDALKAMVRSHAKSGGKFTRHHDYHDAAGMHVMRAMRFDFPRGKKQFGQAHRTSDGRWVNEGMRAPRPLYRLPDLTKADPELAVLVTEGEKCADACALLGLLVTTSSQGAQAASKTNWSPLRGRRTVVLPDNDSEGRKYCDHVTRLLGEAGARSVSVLELEGLGEGEDVFDWIEQRRSEGMEQDAIRKLLVNLAANARPIDMPAPGARTAAPTRPQIEIVAGQLRETVEAAEAALLANTEGEEAYQRGTQVVRVALVDEPAPPRRGTQMPSRMPVIIPIAATYLRSMFEGSAQFLRREGKEMKAASCPSDVAACYLQSAGRWHLPVLRSIVTSPTLRNDGTMVQTAGYDTASRLLFDPCGVSFPFVPEKPTLADARAAADRILELVRLFDFVDDGSRSVWLAGVLTALVRHNLPSAPMFVFDAPTRGSGKSKLAAMIGIIGTGRPPSTMSLVDDVDETRKRILALLMQGAPVINLDNLELPIGGAPLCSVLTEQTFSDRILGASEIVRVPTISTWIATGNNVVIDGDMTRRVLVGRLDPKCERPEDRRFDFDPVGVAEQQRPDLVVDALTILRAHAEAGRPQCGISPFGSFENWSEVVRAALVWIGLADPILGRQAISEQDGGAGAIASLFHLWHAALGEREVTTRQVLNEGGQDLSDAIGDVVGGDVAPGNRGRRLGQVLSQWRDRIVGGYQAVRGRPAQGGTHRWVVHATDGGNGGNGGNPGATRATPQFQHDQESSAGGGRRSSRKVPTVPTVPTIEGVDQAEPSPVLQLSDFEFGCMASPDDGMPEQPGRLTPKRGGGGA